ncbi:MAG: 3-methyl-2-oxobutanoate hydroxymethyltransferase [Motiliproteus sp.]
MKNITLHTLAQMKHDGKKFSCLTAYDACFSQLVSEAGVEVILVGDSLGMVLQGNDSTLPVSIDDMAYHTACVKRGNQGSLIMADLPFMSYATTEQAMESAAALMQAGAHLVKLEGAAWLADTISALSERGIPVCAHLGLTPQSVNKLGGYKVQGRAEDDAQAMIDDAKALATAGASILLLECVPSALAKAITDVVDVPVIGIGAGPDTDAQVLVLHDMLGITPGRSPKFVKNFMDDSSTVQEAIQRYADDVSNSRFPGPEHGFE